MPIGIISITKEVERKIKIQKNKIFFGGTFSGNSISTYIGNKTTQFIIKNKKSIFKDLSDKSDFLYNELNKFIKLKNSVFLFINLNLC